MAHRPVRTAVLPVAGLGTRSLPATKAVPKEMLTVVDKPIVQYAIEEAREAGIERFVMVTGRNKGVIEDHFDDAYELEAVLEQRGKKTELTMLQTDVPGAGDMVFTRQQKPLGLGHAVWCARHVVGDEPFAVLLPDDLMWGKPGAVKQLVDVYNQRGGCVVAAEEVPREKTNKYGIIAPGAAHGNVTEVKGLVEKPDPAVAPSTLSIIGRYILQPELFDILAKGERGAGGEIQLTDGMAKLIGKVPFHAVKTDCVRYDCGDKLGFLAANLAVGLARPDLGPALRDIAERLLKG
ncbi:MAG TPA: UTP--glucose-1-phosphate uridylyltransferase GalU [Rhizomicrobium sp.]|jgi:UTP--glucose-1-phosphate uridylyltransferase|nr:UTP--glucose-1-phosphate uridylyltransferase GalU [Rhizomicrobium sp.]